MVVLWGRLFQMSSFGNQQSWIHQKCYSRDWLVSDNWSQSEWFYSWLRFMSIQHTSTFISCFFTMPLVEELLCFQKRRLNHIDALRFKGNELVPDWDIDTQIENVSICFVAVVRTEWCSGHSCVSQDQVRSFCTETWCYRQSSDHVSHARLVKLLCWP